MHDRIPSVVGNDRDHIYPNDICVHDGCEAVVGSDEKRCDEHAIYFTHG
jgi:hypothetical protein